MKNSIVPLYLHFKPNYKRNKNVNTLSLPLKTRGEILALQNNTILYYPKGFEYQIDVLRNMLFVLYYTSL